MYLLIVINWLEKESWHIYMDSENDVYKYFDWLDDNLFVENLIKSGDKQIHNYREYKLVDLNFLSEVNNIWKGYNE